MMKNLKKVLALVIVFAMSLSVVVSAGTIFPDVEDDATYAEAAQILKSLEIIIGDENGNFNPTKIVTRAEMAKILCVITGKGEQAPTDSGFADATASHWASGYIAAAKNAGYINGYSAVAFGPDDTIKWEQAVKLLMAALKYTQMADDNGGYPEGWIYSAAEAGVTGSGAAGSIGEDCTRAKIAMLVYYAIDTDMMKQITYSKDKEWIIAEGETLLNKYMDTYKVEGKVTNSYVLDDALDAGYVNFKITKTNDIDVEAELDVTPEYEGGKLVGYNLIGIDATGTNAADLLAYSTVAYIYKNDDDELSIIAIAPKGTKNQTLEISDMSLVYDEMLDYNERDSKKPNFTDSENYKFAFWNDRDADSAITTIKLDPNMLVVLNSEAPVSIASFEGTDLEILSDIVPVRGKITLVDTDNDGYYDLYEAKNYEVAVVDSVNADRLRISFKSERTMRQSYVSLDTDVNTNLKDYSLTLDGKDIELKDLAENDVLTISTNDFTDPRYFDIKVSREKVEGKVTATKDKDEIFYVANEEYELVAGINGLGYSDITINDEGTYYLDVDGYVAYIDAVSNVSDRYAYLDRIAVDGMGTVTMRMFTYEGTKLTTEVADKIKINGTRVVLADEVTEAALEDMFGADKAAEIYPAMDGADYIELIDGIIGDTTTFVDADLDAFVTFKLVDGAVAELNFASRTGSDYKDFTYVTNATDVEWQADYNKFKYSKTLSSNAKVFIIDGTIDDWKVIEPTNLVNENEYSPYYFAYQNDGTMGAAVIFQSSTNINENGSLAFFKDYRSGIYGADETEVCYVTYWTEGKLAEKTIAVDADIFDENIEIGDAFLFGTNSDGIVDEMQVIFSPTFGQIDLDGVSEYMMLDSDEKLDNEVFFGVVGKANSGRINLLDMNDAEVDADGKPVALEFDNEKIITVDETASVIAYNGYASDSKKLQESDYTSIMASTYAKTETNGIKFTEYDDNGNGVPDSYEDLSWAFVRLYNGTVVEVVTVEYFNK